MVVHLISVAFTGFILYLSVPGSDLFSWHPTCMSVAFILLLLQAIVVFSPESSLFPTTPRPEKVQLHWILHAFGTASAVFGFAAVYLNKEMNNRKHFTTWHGKFGLATVVGVFCAVVGGLVAKYALNFRKYVKPINIKMYHATAGMIVFCLAMATVFLAGYSNWYKNRVSGWLWRITIWMPVVLATCVARQVTQSYLPRVLTPRESELDAKAKKIQEKIEEKLRRQQERKRSGNNGKSSESEDPTELNSVHN
ncbi:hypothetical protein TCAL_06858 [Tigriopus californicus]|uniref:ascorbate ferrireductase (transmembrane) n=1 Tax=Tigriopus californicus TaxID=6832 RepID=A0A553NC43_TIGCA|nr:transmembrane reductase CYB561D2-like [Tigriopus californicus]TRY62968.1 hypothetical protein TCAL_06858 [Tigriopus californicus]|eukprot:TCALIF_06858-PA protein Name:"Similar to CYB561D1 Cytochrome b561 domain-containing protein 1 (Homo sapiens)" AED:0.13 eAED:0.13 QI:0/-1/0/1/-1/1/1/0/251